MQGEEAILYDIVLKRAKRAVIVITGKGGNERVLIHLGDPKGDHSTTTMERLDEFQVTLLLHPPYSLDISSCDFSSFNRGKDAMRCQSLQAAEAVRVFIVDFARNLDSSAPISLFRQSIANLKQFIGFSPKDWGS